MKKHLSITIIIILFILGIIGVYYLNTNDDLKNGENNIYNSKFSKYNFDKYDDNNEDIISLKKLEFEKGPDIVLEIDCNKEYNSDEGISYCLEKQEFMKELMGPPVTGVVKKIISEEEQRFIDLVEKKGDNYLKIVDCEDDFTEILVMKLCILKKVESGYAKVYTGSLITPTSTGSKEE